MADFLELVGSKIRGYRKAAGLTQAMLAGKAQLHTTYISDIERGAARSLSIVTLQEIARVLKVNVAELVHVDQKVSSAVEEKLAVCVQGIRKQELNKQIFLLNVLEKMVEEIEKT